MDYWGTQPWKLCADSFLNETTAFAPTGDSKVANGVELSAPIHKYGALSIRV